MKSGIPKPLLLVAGWGPCASGGGEGLSLLAGLWGAAAGARAGATASAAAADGDCSGELSELRSSALNDVGWAVGDVALLGKVCCWDGIGLRNTDGEGGAASDSGMSRTAAGNAGGSGEARCCCWGLGEPGFGGGDDGTAASAVPMERPAAKARGLVAQSNMQQLRRQLTSICGRVAEPCHLKNSIEAVLRQSQVQRHTAAVQDKSWQLLMSAEWPLPVSRCVKGLCCSGLRDVLVLF